MANRCALRHPASMKALRSLASVLVLALFAGCRGEPPRPSSPTAVSPLFKRVPTPSLPRPAPKPTLAAFDIDPVIIGLGRGSGGPGGSAASALAATGIERL